jgi:uncharacterized damage-inducible protein DinB
VKELNRISNLFEDLYNGDPWIGVNIRDTIKSLTPVEAAKKVFANSNSIWQILNHLLQWRINLLNRLNGEKAFSPVDNYFIEITDTTEEAWKKLLSDFDKSQEQWLLFLKNADEDSLDIIEPGSSYSRYTFIHGILQHDAYHLGQISMLAKQVKTKPS